MAAPTSLLKDIFGCFEPLLNLTGKGLTYSLVHLVWPNTESLISQPFMGLSKIRLLLQDPVSPRYVRFFWRYHIFHLLFCPTHAHIIRSSMGVYSRICSEAGRLDLFAEKSN